MMAGKHLQHKYLQEQQGSQTKRPIYTTSTYKNSKANKKRPIYNTSTYKNSKADKESDLHLLNFGKLSSSNSVWMNNCWISRNIYDLILHSDWFTVSRTHVYIVFSIVILGILHFMLFFSVVQYVVEVLIVEWSFRTWVISLFRSFNISNYVCSSSLISPYSLCVQLLIFADLRQLSNKWCY